MATRSRRSEPVHTRTPLEAERGVCAGGHPAVADAGVRLMQEGGNAIDALVGAAFTAFVVEPAMCGLGGYARISVYAPDRGGFLSFDAYARAPLAATPGMFGPARGRCGVPPRRGSDVAAVSTGATPSSRSGSLRGARHRRRRSGCGLKRSAGHGRHTEISGSVQCREGPRAPFIRS